MIKIILTCIVLSAICVSCEGMRAADGRVIDITTKDPIDSVLCTVVETGEFIYTDSNGEYELHGPFGGCVTKCPDMTVTYEKSGYQSITILNPQDNTIELIN